MKKFIVLLMTLVAVFMISCSNDTPEPTPEPRNCKVQLVVTDADVRECTVKEGEYFSIPEDLPKENGGNSPVMYHSDFMDRYFLDEKVKVTRDIVFTVDWSDLKVTVEENGTVSGVTGNSSLLVIPKKVGDSEVKAIGENFLKGNKTVEQVIIQDGVEKIAANAFKDSAVDRIYLPSSINEVGAGAFEIPGLEKRIYLTGGLKPNWSEGWNTGFEGLFISTEYILDANGLKYAKTLDFEGNEVLIVDGYFAKGESLVIPASVNGMKVWGLNDSVFSGNKTLKTVVLSEGLEYIGSFAFYKSSISNISLPDSLMFIGHSLFRDMANLTEIELPDNLKVIPYATFYRAKSLKNVKLPARLEEIGDHAFNGAALEYDELVLPESAKKIGNLAFGSQVKIKRIVLPEGVEFTGKNVFDGWTADQTISFATLADFEGVLSGWNTGCEAKDEKRDCVDTNQDGAIYRKITGTDGNPELELYVGPKEVRDYIIPEEIDGVPVTRIAQNAFFLNHVIESVTIPNTVKSIGQKAFYECFNLESIVIPNSVETLGESIFEYCNALKNVTLPANLLEIPNSAFKNCSGLQSITIPSTVTAIGDKAFFATEIPMITIPASVKTIGSEAFAYIYNICPAIVFEAGSQLETMGKQVFFNTWIKEMTLPDGLKVIPSGAFNSCQKLEKLTLPSKLEVIESDAFRMCKLMDLTDYTLPATLKRIEPHAFAGTYGIKNLIIPSTVEYVGFNVFEGWKNDQQLTVEKNEHYAAWNSNWADSCNAQVNNKNV